MPQRLTGHTQLVGILANPIRHSKSPMMHNTAFEALGLDYAYLAFEVAPEDLADAVRGMKALGVRGFNVSMPYKRAILPFLDAISPISQLCESVNTVLVEEGRLYGTVTDGVGYFRSLQDEGYSVRGQKITVMGGGGAAAAICMQAALDGAAEIAIVNRPGPSMERAEGYAANINAQTTCRAAAYPLEPALLRREIGESTLLCNATSVGMGALEGQSVITDPTLLHPDLLCSDVIYAPAETAFLTMAKEAGCPTVNGLGMVLYQGAESFRIWTGREMPVDVVRRVLD